MRLLEFNQPNVLEFHILGVLVDVFRCDHFQSFNCEHFKEKRFKAFQVDLYFEKGN